MFDFLVPFHKQDGYKAGHPAQYVKDVTLVSSNLTARKSRVEGVSETVLFGPQYYVEEYLVQQFNKWFETSLDAAIAPYKRTIKNYLGPDAMTFDHIADLHKLGYLPLVVKAVPEGTLVPMRVPLLTIRNSRDAKHFAWLTNSLETQLSNALWLPITSATTAFQYRRMFEKYAILTGANKEFVKWQAHDFSYRGLTGLEAACMSGAAHLLCSYGTDCIPAIPWLERYYGANSDTELVGGSVPATEHSVMSMGLRDGELGTIRRLITEVYPKGIVSIVCDTWDFYGVLSGILPQLRREILARDGKVVIRPDSGDPVKIICGDPEAEDGRAKLGAIRLLANTFGATKNAAGFYELDPHVGLIYGDSITPERQYQILERLKQMGYASSNVVLGIGSYTYQYVTRDTYGLAMKATYGESDSLGPQAIYKDPKTDDGTKKSAVGLLSVERGADGHLFCRERCTWEQEESVMNLLQPIFIDGKVHNFQTLGRIRARIEEQL